MQPPDMEDMRHRQHLHSNNEAMKSACMYTVLQQPQPASAMNLQARPSLDLQEELHNKKSCTAFMTREVLSASS